MAIGPALTLLSALALQAGECELTAAGRLGIISFLRPVNLYCEGHSAEALRELEKVRPGVVERMIEREAAGLSDGCIQAACLLETERAMTFAAQLRWEDSDRHFDSAWRILHLIRAPTKRHTFQRDWLLAAGLFLHQLIFVHTGDEGGFARADRFLQNAVERYPDDAEVLLAAGSLLEWAGSLRFGESAHLKEAEELYARARRVAPFDPLILLRHGKVLEKLGRYREAEAPLLQVLELPSKDDLRYRSRMTLGGMAERDGRHPDAIAHYEGAAALISSWQVAHVALAHTLHSSGAHDRARDALQRALSLSVEEGDRVYGGWWIYELGISLRFEPLLERMRAEVRR